MKEALQKSQTQLTYFSMNQLLIKWYRLWPQ